MISPEISGILLVEGPSEEAAHGFHDHPPGLDDHLLLGLLLPRALQPDLPELLVHLEIIDPELHERDLGQVVSEDFDVPQQLVDVRRVLELLLQLQVDLETAFEVGREVFPGKLPKIDLDVFREAGDDLLFDEIAQLFFQLRLFDGQPRLGEQEAGGRNDRDAGENDAPPEEDSSRSLFHRRVFASSSPNCNGAGSPRGA